MVPRDDGGTSGSSAAEPGRARQGGGSGRRQPASHGEDFFCILEVFAPFSFLVRLIGGAINLV